MAYVRLWMDEACSRVTWSARRQDACLLCVYGPYFASKSAMGQEKKEGEFPLTKQISSPDSFIHW